MNKDLVKNIYILKINKGSNKGCDILRSTFKNSVHRMNGLEEKQDKNKGTSKQTAKILQGSQENKNRKKIRRGG